MKKNKFITRKIIVNAAINSLLKLNPFKQIKNPVMFVVYVGAIFITVLSITNIFKQTITSFDIQITFWLWITLLFANFSEALAEGQEKAVTDNLKKTRTDTIARRLINGDEIIVKSNELSLNDIVVCEANEIIPCDGEIIEGIASVDESAITGESAPVIRESGNNRNIVTMGTKVLSDRIVIKVTSEQGKSFLDRMILLIESAKRQKTPNEISLTVLLAGLTLVFLFVIISLVFFVNYTIQNSLPISGKGKIFLTIPVLMSFLVCLIPTTIGGLLSAIGISGMYRLLKKNVIAISGKAVETAGDIDILLLDKTGTITYGNRMANEIIPAPKIDINKLANASYLSSLSDDTPEGQSIVSFVSKNFKLSDNRNEQTETIFIPFSANTRMSGVDIKEVKNGKVIRSIKKGAYETIKKYITGVNGYFPDEVSLSAENISKKGGTPLVVIENNEVLGVIYLKDVIKSGVKERFENLRKMGIKTIMITGDNPLTAAFIAAEAGVDDFIAEATPEAKLEKIKEVQATGHLIGMIGDGTNDAPALAQADVGVAMLSGTQTAKEASNMVDLDNSPTKIIEVVETGKQLLMTRGALTTFSIANDVAKYFAILPAIFINFYLINNTGILSVLNIMKLASPESAILSAVIFNALIIAALIPLALKGVKFKPQSTDIILLKNLLIYGLGGVIVPFIGIKLIDVIINALRII